MRLLMLLMLLGLVAATPATAARPNIVVIQTDDQSMNTMRAMPQTRALIGDAGLTFDDYHVSFSLCCPSRATLLTGQYAHNTGVRSNVPPDGSVLAFRDANTLPVWLRRAGYTTAHVGKYLNLYSAGVPPGWDEWYTGVDPSTYRYTGFTLNENGIPRTYFNGYSSDVFTEKALDVIRRRARQDAPFFLAVDYLAPHTQVAVIPRLIPGGPPVPAARHVGKMSSVELPRDASFDEADVSDKPAHVRKRPRVTAEQVAELTRRYRLRLESLMAVDEGVARIITALRNSGELDNSYIFFISDNGHMDGQHRYTDGKLVVYEPSTHMPLLVRGPMIPRGAHTYAPSMNTDLAPTITELAGATPGLDVDGVSLVPVLQQPRTRWGRYLLHEYVASSGPFSSFDSDAGSNADPSFDGVRSNDGYVYVEHADGSRELYDLGADPLQLNNRANDPALAPVQSRLAAQLQRLRTCKGAACRVVTAPPRAAAITRVRWRSGRLDVRVRCLLARRCRGTLSAHAGGRRLRAVRVAVAARASRTTRLTIRSRTRGGVQVVFDLGADGRATRSVGAR